MQEIKVSDILAHLDGGGTRAQLRTKYSLTTLELKEIFKHPKLKGRRSIRPSHFVLVDDTEVPVEAHKNATFTPDENPKEETPEMENPKVEVGTVTPSKPIQDENADEVFTETSDISPVQETEKPVFSGIPADGTHPADADQSEEEKIKTAATKGWF